MVENTNIFQNLLENPRELEINHISEVRSLIDQYPYFQSARALYLKGLKNSDSFRYNHELKVTAAYTTDRTVLFDYITSDVFDEKKTIHEELKEKISETQTNHLTEEETELTIGKPLQFSKNEKHSFQEWLQLSSYKPIVREEKKESENSQQSIIDRFIQSSPKIIPVKKDQEVEISIPKNKTDKSLMTETLAKVYLEQKKYSKAIKAYEILSLKYPEKSGFFADQIKRIKILKHKKS